MTDKNCGMCMDNDRKDSDEATEKICSVQLTNQWRRGDLNARGHKTSRRLNQSINQNLFFKQ